jgi:diaminopimelate decarboxylase
MNTKKIPFSEKQLRELIKKYPTPFHIYDEQGIRDNARKLYRAFSWVKGRDGEGFKNFFAVKACPNPYILKILREECMGADCSSLPELMLAEKSGISGEDIMFTSNDTPPEEFVKAKQLGAVINLDDISHIEMLEKSAGIPDIICFRFNPGRLKQGNQLIGNPIEAKYGLTRDQIIEAYGIMKEKGVKRFGLHTMVVSNMLDVDYLIDTAKMLFELIVEIHKKVGIDFEFVNLGGGIGIPYRPEDNPVDYDAFSRGVKKYYDKLIVGNMLGPIRVVMECGRAITGPYGFLVMRARHVMHKYRDYVGVDACSANLMRPFIYGAYHHITVLGKESQPCSHIYDVVGSLCENTDKLAVQRKLPDVEAGDVLVQHDTGAHGHAMGFNYNGKLRSAEILLRKDRSALQIRRAETVDDYFSTLDFGGLKKFKG